MKEVIRITSREQFLETYGCAEMPQPDVPIGVLYDFIYGPQTFLDVVRVIGEMNADLK